MARNTARVGRRRRVLKEEVLSASNIAIHNGSDDFEPGDTPRYGAGANIENHPQVTAFVPRRMSTFCMYALAGIGVAVSAELVAHFATPLSQFVESVSPAELTDVFANRLVAWTSATLLLLAVGYTRLVYSLRRHRVDDYRGRYRVWRTAGWAALLVSLNSVLGAHTLIAACLGSLVDWQMLPASAGWWLVPSALLGGWLVIKLMIDASECRSALCSFALGTVCLTIAAAHSAGWSPEWSMAWPDTMGRSLPLLGFTFVLIGTQLFARYVILDVQGLIERAEPAPLEKQSEEKVAKKATKEMAKAVVAEEPAEQETEQVASSSQWVDGSEPETDYGDEPGRRMSKAERKRLRKQKQRNRAA